RVSRSSCCTAWHTASCAAVADCPSATKQAGFIASASQKANGACCRNCDGVRQAGCHNIERVREKAGGADFLSRAPSRADTVKVRLLPGMLDVSVVVLSASRRRAIGSLLIDYN